MKASEIDRSMCNVYEIYDMVTGTSKAIDMVWFEMQWYETMIHRNLTSRAIANLRRNHAYESL